MKPKYIFSIFLLVLLVNCKPNYQQQNPKLSKQKSVVIEQLVPSTDPLPIEVSGIVSSKIEARLSFKLGGVVQRIAVEEGQQVKKGQLLANLNLSEINAQVVQAQNAADKADRDLQRIRNLYRDSVATLEQLQDLETLVELARADLKIAYFNQQYARIAAPTDGKVLKRFVERGELVSPGSPILTVGSHGQNAYVMRVALSDRNIVKLAYGDSAVVRFDAYPEDRFFASVTEIAEAANPATGTFEIELTVDQGVHKIKSGFIGKASIYPSGQQPYLKINLSALVEGHQQKAKVFFYDEQTGKVELAELQPLHIGNTYFTVSAQEATAKGHVITEGNAYIHHGEIVEPYNPQP